MGVLDKSNIPLWVWGYMTRKHKPHTFVLENVPRFDQTLLASLLGPYYKLESLLASPMLIGVPSMGNRLFIKGSIDLDEGMCRVSFCMDMFEMFRRTPIADGNVYVAASDSERRLWHDYLCAMRKIIPARKMFRMRSACVGVVLCLLCCSGIMLSMAHQALTI